MSVVTNIEQESKCDSNTINLRLITLQNVNAKLKSMNEILLMKIQNLKKQNKILLTKIEHMNINIRTPGKLLTINDLNYENNSDGETIYSDHSTCPESSPNTSDIDFISDDYSTDRTYHLTEDDMEEEEEEEEEEKIEEEYEEEDKEKEEIDDKIFETKVYDDDIQCSCESSDDVQMITNNINDIEI